MLALLLLATPWTWHAEGGGQLDTDPHGVLNAGLSTDKFAVELLTDTLELWWRPWRESGRAWLGLRAQGYASQMFVSPWTRGEKDRSRAFIVPHLALHGGIVEHLSDGLYVGVRGSIRGYLFFRRSEATTAPKPDPTFVITPELFVGLYDDLAFEMSASCDVRDGFVSGRIETRASYRPKWTIAPRLEVSGVLGHQLDDLTKTRVGGLNPYVVPLAGAAWAEWWVETYGAARIGLEARWSWGSVAFVTDAVLLFDETQGDRFDDSGEAGFGLLSRFWFDTFFIDASLGYAPWIERGSPLERVSLWFLIGTTPRQLGSPSTNDHDDIALR
jgi:hypothetical protein